ncbi:hypothetical protein C0Q70_20269 [Pomacea canaliculata]|uniref:Uncharacterized protein n=1 Tax=Pomacea canaliculata TaxID=400727 RepID=A0A2T7NF27_POMCA|nr:hypothetical protein C0Q70_20269 [Pomacea canaliculata]
MTTAACGVGVAKVKKVVLSCFQASLLNLYNVRTKVRCANAPFRSEKELPLPSVLNTSVIEQCVDERLAQIFEDDDEERLATCFIIACLPGLADILQLVQILAKRNQSQELAEDDVRGVQPVLGRHLQCGVQDKVFKGILPTPSADTSVFSVEVDDLNNKVYVHWSREDIGHDFLQAVQRMLKQLRDEGRQPSEAEYFATHLATCTSATVVGGSRAIPYR